MIALTYEEKKSLGFQFLLDSLNANSVYGQELIKSAAPYAKEQKAELKLELKRLAQLVAGYQEQKFFWDSVELILMNMKEVRGSLKNGKENVLTDLELFELKQFLLQSEKLLTIYEGQKDLQLPGIEFQNTVDALNVLDPEHRRMPGFYIADAYSEELSEVRARKKHLEVVLRQEHTEEKREHLLNQRKEAVVKEEAIQQRIREEITVQLRPWLEHIQRNCEMVGCMDFLIQKAKIALRYQGICPNITASELELTDMINPSLVEVLQERGKKFAPITFLMQLGTAVITGANMGGGRV